VAKICSIHSLNRMTGFPQSLDKFWISLFNPKRIRCEMILNEEEMDSEVPAKLPPCNNTDEILIDSFG